jgi:hypothetical protein
MTGLRQAAEDYADHRKTDERRRRFGRVAVKIARHAAKAADPNECSLQDPAFRQNFKTDSGSRTFNNPVVHRPVLPAAFAAFEPLV